MCITVINDFFIQNLTSGLLLCGSTLVDLKSIYMYIVHVRSVDPQKNCCNFLFTSLNSQFPTPCSSFLQRHSFDIHNIIIAVGSKDIKSLLYYHIISVVCHTKWCIVYSHVHVTILGGGGGQLNVDGL